MATRTDERLNLCYNIFMSNSRNIILASTSQGRKELLEQTGIKFTVEASDYDEDMTMKVPPTELVKILSEGKAQAVASRYEDAIIVGADSIAILGEKVLGKPKDANDAARMLRELSGKMHVFTTGFTVIDTNSGRKVIGLSETKVYFKELTDDEIKGYVATGESVGHAGAYSIQQKGAMLVARIEGEYTNIIGLPLAQLSSVLKDFGVNALVQEEIGAQI